jgi:hypothetical protein
MAFNRIRLAISGCLRSSRSGLHWGLKAEDKFIHGVDEGGGEPRARMTGPCTVGVEGGCHAARVLLCIIGVRGDRRVRPTTLGRRCPGVGGRCTLDKVPFWDGVSINRKRLPGQKTQGTKKRRTGSRVASAWSDEETAGRAPENRCPVRAIQPSPQLLLNYTALK